MNNGKKQEKGFEHNGVHYIKLHLLQEAIHCEGYNMKKKWFYMALEIITHPYINRSYNINTH